MTDKHCLCCGKPFKVRPQNQNQSHCSEAPCQKHRRHLWQIKKLRDDPHYRENQRDAQLAWRLRNPDYTRNYRAKKSSSTGSPIDSHLSTVPIKNLTRLRHPIEKASLDDLQCGVYQIRLMRRLSGEKMVAWIVEITSVSCKNQCKKDLCKDSTC